MTMNDVLTCFFTVHLDFNIFAFSVWVAQCASIKISLPYNVVYFHTDRTVELTSGRRRRRRGCSRIRTVWKIKFIIGFFSFPTPKTRSTKYVRAVIDTLL